MKTTLLFLFGLIFSFASFAQTNIIINDTWADGNRTSTGTDGSGVDSAWYASSGSTLTVPSAGDLQGTVGTGSSFWTTYFPTPVTLVNPGDTLTLTWVFVPTGVAAQNSSQGFNLAIVNTPGTQLSADGSSPSAQAYAGYAMFMNMGTTLGASTSFGLREWVAGSGNLLGTSANWGANGTASANLANVNGNTHTGYSAGTQYTFSISFTLDTVTNGTLDITSTMTGSGLNGVGFMSDTNFDATPNSLTFNTFGIRPTSAATSASQFDTSLLQVLYIQPVPEPSTIAIVGLGIFGMVAARRLRRR